MVGSGASESNTLPKGEMISHKSTKAAQETIVDFLADTVFDGISSCSCAIMAEK